MADITQSLFGITPESYQQAQNQALQAEALKFAQLDPMQQAQMGAYMAGSRIGTGLGGLLGAEDPTLQKIKTLQSIMSSGDTTTFEGQADLARKLGQAGFAQQALQMAQSAQSLREQTAKAGTESNKLAMEMQLRDELSKLSPDASEEDILKVVTKYGSPDKVLAALQSSQARKEAAQARKEQAAASDATRLEIARMNNETRQFLGSLTNSLKDKPLSSTDLKMVNEARQAFQAADFNLSEAKTFIGLLDDKKMNFGAGENALSVVRTALGSSNESDQNKINLQQWVEKASADVLRMDVGVKTEGDAQRAKSQVLSALSKNDAKAVKTSLEQYVKVLENAKSIQQDKLTTIATERNRPGVAEVPSRRQAGTADNPIVLK